MTPEQELEDAVSPFDRMAVGENENPEKIYHRVAAAMHSLCAAILRAEESHVEKEHIRALVEPARDFHACSPLVRRFQTWPRGYAGDYETIEYLCEAVNHAEPLTVPWFIEQAALRSGCAQQHRSKIAWQATKVLQTCLQRREARILSVACGGSRHLRMVQHSIAGSVPQLWLNDVDAEALDYSRTRLTPSGCQLETIPGNVFRSVRKLEAGAPYDLILLGGLFDYLNERRGAWLLSQLSSLLTRGGKLCFTNIATGNPDRVWLEYVAGWSLIERDEKNLQSLVQESQVPGVADLSIERDPTGLTCLTELALAA
jgi:extracellular factor (EF) 3-hydroxypalmitic acid methyl ester biosynthesis protein